jgi:hypothetical protein
MPGSGRPEGGFMRTRDLILFLGLELLAIAVAGLSFTLIESRLIAGFTAGAYFLSFGLFVLWKIARSGKLWRMLMTYPLLVHVFGVSFPMLITRALNADRAFESVFILGMPGPVFHQLSSTVFSILMLATLIDLWRVWQGDLKAART